MCESRRIKRCSESPYHLNKVIRFRTEGERIGQFWRIMGPLMDIKVFNTNLIRFVLIFNHVNMNGIMMKSFFEVS